MATPPTLDRVTEIVRAACADHNAIAEPQRQIDLAAGADARLYGKDGVLDSLGLVSLLASIEQALEDDLGIQVTIADEKAFSQTRSPFRSLGALAAYVHQLAQESR